MNTQFNTSFAGTGRQYVQGQGRMRGSTVLHLQFPGTDGNRDYGLSADVSVPQTVVNFINAQSPNAKSLQGNGKPYIQLQASVDNGSDTIHFQAKGVNGNRNYGMSFDAKNTELAAWLRGQLTDQDDEDEDEDVEAEIEADDTDLDAVLNKVNQIEALVAEIKALL